MQMRNMIMKSLPKWYQFCVILCMVKPQGEKIDILMYDKKEIQYRILSKDLNLGNNLVFCLAQCICGIKFGVLQVIFRS